MQTKTRQLWGQEIDIVKGGLDEEQVIPFVNELVDKYRFLAEKQQHFVSLGTLSEKAAIEAEKLATDIKARAKKESDAEAARIVAEAMEKARGIVSQGEKAAQNASRHETEAILSAARRKADIIETEAKQLAELFLIRSREIIEANLKTEVQDVYRQLITSLQDHTGDVDKIDLRWKDKRVQLGQKETFGLRGYEDLNSSLATEAAGTRPVNLLDDLEAAPTRPSSTATLPTEAAEDQTEVVFKATITEDVLTEAPEQEKEVAVDEQPAAASTLEDQVEQKPQVDFVPPHDTGTYDASHLEGEVDLRLIAPVDLAVMSEILAELQTNPEVRIMRTVGSYDKGTTITILLDRALPLVGLLAKIPGVEIDSQTDLPRGTDERLAGSEERQPRRPTIQFRTRH